MDRMLGRDQAFPGTKQFPTQAWESGLTKREWFAGMALQGLLSGLYELPEESAMEMLACQALLAADALLEELADGGKRE